MVFKHFLEMNNYQESQFSLYQLNISKYTNVFIVENYLLIGLSFQNSKIDKFKIF